LPHRQALVASLNPESYAGRYSFEKLLTYLYTGWPKKVSHYQESSLNRIKNREVRFSAILITKQAQQYYMCVY